MNNRWMKMSVLALSMSAITGTLYADDQVAQADVQNSTAVSEATTVSDVTPTSNSVQEDAVAPTNGSTITESEPTSANPEANQAATALQKQEGDASQETNLQEVFTSNERQYSLIKKGEISTYYDLDYTYYRDSILDLALGDDNSSISRLSIRKMLSIH